MDGSVMGPGVEPVRVERWPTEIPLFVLVALAAAGIWVLAVVSMIGAIYAALIGVFLFFTHLAFVAHLRGSAVRLGPEQFPDLYRRVVELAEKAGIRKEPEVYIMQAGGTLNALATKFLRSDMIVLFSDLLDACGTSVAARDMIVGHELGHIRCRHLRWRMLLFPGFLVPFLGTAYSRACEYTCDRYGAALCGERDGASLGLSILAAGASHAGRVNLNAMVRQREHLNTGWMTIGKWLSTHPPLSERIAALDPPLGSGPVPSVRGPVRALAILATLMLVPLVGTGYFISRLLPRFREAQQVAQRRAQAPRLSAKETADARGLVQDDLRALAMLAEEHRTKSGGYPADEEELYEAWDRHRPGQRVPHDPFDGQRYSYAQWENAFVMGSAGPDGEDDTNDDIALHSGEWAPQ